MSLMLAVQAGKAQTYLMENFNYGTNADTLTNPAIGGSIWKRHSGTGGPFSYTPTGLTFAGYTGSGIGGAIGFAHATVSKEDANAVLPVMTTGNVYASFLLNVSAGGGTGTTADYFYHLSDSQGSAIGTTFRARLFIRTGTGANTFNIGVTKAGAASVAAFSGDYALNTTHLIVLKYMFLAGSDSVYLFVIPNGSSIPATEPAPTIAATDVTGSDLARVRSICIRQGTAGVAAGTMDAFRVSQTWGDGPLPVKWNSFTAKASDNSVLLNWSTSSEKNNQYFMVEKSNDGENFEAIAKVSGNGNSNRVNKYSFTDNDFTSASAYYRIRQVDFDGKFSFSSTLVLKNEVSPLEVSPNPFNDNLNIAATNSETIISAEIHDIQGKLIQSASGKGNVHMNTSELPNGMYFLRTKQGNTTEVKRIVKK